MEADLYLQVREKEGRLYSDDVVARLPIISAEHPHANEWRARSASATRLTRYLSDKQKPPAILELGCGNGWLSNQLSECAEVVAGIDQNLHELKQAARVFSQNSKLGFLQTDIFSAPFDTGCFDVIVFASVIQYFQDLPLLISTVKKYLKPQGEIHVIDSPLYSDDEVEAATQRSQEYYSSLGFPEMASHYFHHRESTLKELGAKTLYSPRSFSNRLNRLLAKNDSSFPWNVFTKQHVE
jgi:ubiquinone/menaquinone biosynthesis C-methylase UbiE